MTLPATVGWLLTYAVHSTVLLGAALLVSAAVRSDVWRDVAWKTALVGGLVTASLPALPVYRSPVASWSAGLVGEVDPASAAGAGTATPASHAAPARGGSEAPPAPPDDGRDADASAGRSPDAERAGSGRAGATWTAIVAVWGGIAALLLARLAIVNVRFFGALRPRIPVRDGPLAEMLARLRREAGYWRPVRLTQSETPATPLAIGGGEICLPARYASQLDPEQQRGGLAHELAHLRRRDPAWRLLTAVIEAVLFFQPLNRLARRRLEESAEHLCDDWAVTHTGSRTGLARCLSDIADWVGGARAPREAVAIAEGGSPLLKRVRRLADANVAERQPAWWRHAGAALPVALVAAFAPVVSGERPPQASLLPSPFPPEACAVAAIDTASVDASGLALLDLGIPVGFLRVEGSERDDVRIVSRRCGSRRDLFEALELRVGRTSDELHVAFEVPTHLFSRTRGGTAGIDVLIEAPRRLFVAARNAIGDVEVSGVAALRLDDQLGDVRVHDIAGDVEIAAGPGDVFVAEVEGGVLFTGSVGRLVAERVGGSVTVAGDHTGPVEIRDVRADVTIHDGQAGDVFVDGVLGDLFVGRITEGRLHAERVAGRVFTSNESGGQDG